MAIYSVGIFKKNVAVLFATFAKSPRPGGIIEVEIFVF